MLAAAIYISIILYLLWRLLKKPEQYPPGHWGIPLFGYIPYNEKSAEENILSLRRQYGKTALWRIGTKIIVFLFDFDQIKDVLQSDEFTERPDLIVLKFLAEGNNRGIIASKGRLWHNGRRFSLRVMRDMGMGKSRLTSAVHYEAVNLVESLEEIAGSPVKLPTAFHVAVVNVVWQMVGSKRYSFDDPDLKYFELMIQELQENLIRYSIQDIFPWLRTVMPGILRRVLLKEKVANDVREKLKNFIGDLIKEHEQNLDSSDPKDYIDAYLLEMKAQENEIDSTMSYDDLIVCICDLFGAGSETTTTTLHWIIFYLATYPEVQRKLQKEIDHVMPKGSCVSSDDRTRMPYTEAVIHEVHRHASMTGLIARMANKDTIIDGHFIPKGAIISPVVVFCHHDADCWEEPHLFRPERFLDEDGNFQMPKRGFIPFGYGKRQCLGEPLAKMQLFIFTVTIFQSLEFKPPPGNIVDLKAATANPLSRIPNTNQKLIINIR